MDLRSTQSGGAHGALPGGTRHQRIFLRRAAQPRDNDLTLRSWLASR
jgi:hypothetical protein